MATKRSTGTARTAGGAKAAAPAMTAPLAGTNKAAAARVSGKPASSPKSVPAAAQRGPAAVKATKRDAAAPPRPNELREWQALERHKAKIEKVHLRKLFADDPQRGKKFVLEAGDLYFDFSKNR